MFGISSALVFAAIWLHLYGNISAHYERLQHVPQYEIPPEIGNQDDIYNELKFAESHGGYVDGWPWSNEFQDTAFGKGQDKPSDVYDIGPKTDEELQHSANIPEQLPIPMALASNGKLSPAKKNLYMSRCSFKICNMGRKRNARYLRLYDIMENLRSTRSLKAKSAPAM